MKDLNRQAENKHKYATGFAIAGSLITILFFAIVNHTTGSSFPWFIFPSFAVLWWPLSIIFAGRHAMKAFSLPGSLIIIVFMFIVNHVTSPAYPWFIYAAFAVIWWPLSVFLAGRHAKVFSIAGSLIIMAFVFIVNYVTSPAYSWFVYPAFAAIWWPLSIFFAGRNTKVFSIAGSLVIIAFVVIVNYATSPAYPWFIYPAFAAIWWPLSIFFAGRHAKLFSLAGSLIIIAFLYMTNFMTSPEQTWFLYPSFAVIWWPLSMFLGNPRTIKAYSIVGALMILAFLITVNIVYTPFYPWSLYAVLPVLMWPAGVFLGKRAGDFTTAVVFSFVVILYYTALNFLLSPAFPWAIFPAYAVLWWPAGIALAKRGHLMLFSLCGALLSAALFIAVNLITTPHSIWAVYPIFTIAWWPLSVYYFVYKRKRKMLAQ
jgi:hypothetical protein